MDTRKIFGADPAPAGLMIMAPKGDDDRLLRVGKAIESTIVVERDKIQ